jgi:hypothetical protein
VENVPKQRDVLRKEIKMPVWFWPNIPAMVPIFLLTTGIPLWMALKEPT